jgi:hypothetical protein
VNPSCINGPSIHTRLPWLGVRPALCFCCLALCLLAMAWSAYRGQILLVIRPAFGFRDDVINLCGWRWPALGQAWLT